LDLSPIPWGTLRTNPWGSKSIYQPVYLSATIMKKIEKIRELNRFLFLMYSGGPDSFEVFS